MVIEKKCIWKKVFKLSSISNLFYKNDHFRSISRNFLLFELKYKFVSQETFASSIILV